MADSGDAAATRLHMIRLIQRYPLASPVRAKAVEITTQYRSYVINYWLGQDMVRADVEAAGND